MRRHLLPILIAAFIGMAAPAFWGTMELVFIHARLWPSVDRLWNILVHITCPVWDLNLPGNLNDIALPVLNGTLYAVIVFACLQVKARWHKHKASTA